MHRCSVKAGDGNAQHIVEKLASSPASPASPASSIFSSLFGEAWKVTPMQCIVILCQQVKEMLRTLSRSWHPVRPASRAFSASSSFSSLSSLPGKTLYGFSKPYSRQTPGQTDCAGCEEADLRRVLRDLVDMLLFGEQEACIDVGPGGLLSANHEGTTLVFAGRQGTLGSETLAAILE